MQVVRVGAHCELDSTAGSRASFSVVEFAVLSDGSRFTSDRGLGFGSRVHQVPRAAAGEPDFWATATRDRLAQSVLITVEARYEDATPERRWSGLIELVRAAGAATSADDLGSLDYAVEFGPGVLARLRAPGS